MNDSQMFVLLIGILIAPKLTKGQASCLALFCGIFSASLEVWRKFT